MKKNLSVKFAFLFTSFALFALLLAFSPAAFAAAAEAEFDAALPLFNFIEENPSHTAAVDLEFGESAKFYQTQDTIVGYYDSQMEGIIAFYKTKNPNIVFGSGIRVGADIQGVIKDKKIPGDMKEFNEYELPPGESRYTWTLPGSDLVFRVKAIDNKISEITFRNPGAMAAMVDSLLIQ